MKKQNPTIENIVISEEKLAEYNSKLKPNPKSEIQLSREGQLSLIKLYFGICCVCAMRATKKLRYNNKNAIIIEKYCDKCLEKVTQPKQEQELTDNNNKVKLLDTGQRNKTVAVRMDEWKERNGYGTNTKT